MAKANFAMGCFWKPEALFRQMRGVIDTTVGYCGGHVQDPTYRQVCSEDTGHAEAVLVEYDPKKVSFTDLLNVFWNNHSVSTQGRQGPDVTSQYRSAIFCMDEAQLAEATASRDAKAGGAKLDVQITLSDRFYPAEEYHQRYLEKQGSPA